MCYQGSVGPVEDKKTEKFTLECKQYQSAISLISLAQTSALLAKMYSSSPEVVLLNSNVTRVFAHFSIKD